MNRINLFNRQGDEINLESLGLLGLKLAIPSPTYRVVTEQLDGLPGEIAIESILDSRQLIASFMATSTDYVDSLQSRDLLYEIIGNGQEMYVSESKQPTKRWKVHASGWSPERANAAVSLFEVPLLAISGTSESINIIENSFNTSTFKYENKGNILLNPTAHAETEIEFSGASSSLVIRNLTTNDEWSWGGTTILGDTLLLKNSRSLKNEGSILGLTNKKLITLAKGWNDFEVVGATSDFELTVRTRFYFL